MNNKFLKLAVLVGAIALFSGCGSSNSNKTRAKAGYKGVFVDSAVGGISWACGGKSNVTGADGVFGECPHGTSVTFSVGNVVLGTVAPTDDNIFTPQDVVGVPRGTSDNEEVNVMSAMLLSLDSDGDPTNGVTITPAITTAFEEAVPAGTKMADLDEAKVVEAIATTNKELVKAGEEIELTVVAADAAAEHLIETAGEIEAGTIKAPVQPVLVDESTN